MLHILLHFILSTLFSIYIRVRKLYHAVFDRVAAVLNYHHRTPERKTAFINLATLIHDSNNPPVIARDVKSLPRIPKHLSIILTLPPDQKDVTLLLNRLDVLIHDACEITAWSTAAGISTLSIYERSGTHPLSHPQSQRSPPTNSPLNQASSSPP